MSKSIRTTPALPLGERLKKVEEQSPKTFDALNVAIIETEPVLKALNPVEGTWIECGSTCDDEGHIEVERKLGFDKHEGKWRLMHFTYFVDEQHGITRLLTDVPIAARLEAVVKVPALQEKIVKEKELFVGKVNDAVLMLKSLKS